MQQRASSRTLRRALAAAGLAAVATPASAYEYRLAYTVVGNYKDLVVAGYRFAGPTVVGNCSYTRITTGSGRDPKTYYTPIPQTCTWDRQGALLSVAPGAPDVPAPIAYDGTRTVYALASDGGSTGTDSAYPGGYVITPGSHETWLTSMGYLVLPPGPYTFTATVASDGDVPLNVTAVTARLVQTRALVVVNWTTCVGQVAVGATCDVNVTYDFHKLRSTTGLAYDTMTIHLASDAALVSDFVQSYTLEVKVPKD